ncbi:hypothetical protein [uncultured Corynebacterium sp.]|uniref:hypothetical protein n=1 Tax=uncultured Corynebacterium sp. TaxID=159447 RepID=UPI00259587AF|nr:hypothetical protein [uncultured Corynebacterium sp.]
MAQRDNSDVDEPLVVAKRPPHIGEIAAAKLLIKMVERGQIDREITPLLRWIAEYGDVDESRVPDIVLQPRDQSA